MSEFTISGEGWRYLKYNASCETPRHLIFVDTETSWIERSGKVKSWTHRMRLGVALYVRLDERGRTEPEELRFTTDQEFWEWIYSKLRPKTAVWLFAHNVGFDLSILQLWRRIEGGELRLHDPEWQLRALLPSGTKKKRPWRGMLVLEDPPTIITLRQGTSTLKIVDTLNYWKLPLWQLGESCELPKLPMPEQSADDAEWFEYCARDTEIICESVCRLIREWKARDMGNWSYTAAGLAMNHYRHRHLTKPILLHQESEVKALERASYYAGRCAAFYIGRFPGDAYHLDVKSFYPSIMAELPMPQRLDFVRPQVSISTLKDVLREHLACAEVEIETNDPWFPVRIEGRVLYPRGRFWTTLATPEIALALNVGAIRDVGRVACYRPALLFASYVESLWTLRQEAANAGNRAAAHLAKLLLNSLSGKFAQRSHQWEEEPGELSPLPFGQWWKAREGQRLPQLMRSIAWHTQRSCDPGETAWNFPAISAHVTSYGRTIMGELFRVAGDRQVLYSDTDSAHVTATGYDRLRRDGHVDTGRHGDLRFLGGCFQPEYYGPKHYQFDGKMTLAGRKVNGSPNPDGTWVQLEFERLSSILSRPPDGTIVVTERILDTALPSASHRTDSEGWVIPPWVEGSYDDYRNGRTRVTPRGNRGLRDGDA